MIKLSGAKESQNQLRKDRDEKIKAAKTSDTNSKRAESENAQSEISESNINTQKKDLIVRFDKNTTSPFTVKFTDRGFVVGDTRISFETIERAISKEFSITLKTGLILTPVKMQKILKYKSRY